MTKFEELRNNHKSFNYDDYKIEIDGNNINVSYYYSIDNLDIFVTYWTFPYSKKYSDEILNKLVFSLGMVEAISYYKMTCPSIVNINCGSLSETQAKFWKKLFYNGLGEFMYKNNIDISMDDLFKFKYADLKQNCSHDDNTYDGILVPVGGGKDSCVSLELLKNDHISTYCINPNNTINNVITTSGILDNYKVSRKFDSKMLDYNAKGYLNGHTPFSAIVAFSTFICAYLNGIKYIALSNESSANETTVKGSFVNHQYSKSFEFENDFSEYVKDLTDSDIHYFSFLRPLAEIQIAYLFSKTNIYNKVFRSCNVGSKKGIWCCDCPKCLFVYIILSPFIKEEELISIFGEKLLDKPSLEEDFKGLVGINENKPFECVGTRSEVLASLGAYIKNNNSYLTDKYADYIKNNASSIDDMLKSFDHTNNVPEELIDIIIKAL